MWDAVGERKGFHRRGDDGVEVEKNRMETAFSIQSDYLAAEYTDAYQTERKKCR